jgi:hypothetical protein
MNAVGASDPARPPLGPMLWFFVVWKGLGVLFDLGALAFFLVWVGPIQAKLAGSDLSSVVTDQSAFLVTEIVVTGFGVALILRRHRAMRRFWIVVLAVSNLVMLAQLALGMVEEEVLLFLVTGVSWLTYWIVAKKPRELQLASFWIRT